MTTWQAMNRLENLGYQFRADGDRVLFSLIGEPPPEASALLDIVRADRAAAADYVRQRENGATVIDDGCTYSVFDALAIGQAVRRGAAVLLAPVVFHKQALTVSVYWQPVEGAPEIVLDTHKKRIKNALERRLQAMEDQPLEGLTEAEIDRFCEKYSQYKTLLEECR